MFGWIPQTQIGVSVRVPRRRPGEFVLGETWRPAAGLPEDLQPAAGLPAAATRYQRVTEPQSVRRSCCFKRLFCVFFKTVYTERLFPRRATEGLNPVTSQTHLPLTPQVSQNSDTDPSVNPSASVERGLRVSPFRFRPAAGPSGPSGGQVRLVSLPGGQLPLSDGRGRTLPQSVLLRLPGLVMESQHTGSKIINWKDVWHQTHLLYNTLQVSGTVWLDVLRRF